MNANGYCGNLLWQRGLTFVPREAMPAKWDWPLASPLRLKVAAADGSPIELVPYGCAKLRVSMFPDDAGKTKR